MLYFTLFVDGGAASVAAATPADGAAAAAAPVEEKKEWKECDDDMGPLWLSPSPAISKFAYALQDLSYVMPLGFRYK